MNDLVLVDAGASGGIHRRWNKLSTNFQAILFEPDEVAYKRLISKSEPYIHVNNIGLHQTTNKYPVYKCRNPQLSSTYKPNLELINQYPQPERYHVIETTQVEMMSLDGFFQKTCLPACQFIKLDTQGSELAILKGGTRTLNGIIGVEIEVQHLPTYKDVPLFPEVDSFMRDHGFVLSDMCHYYWQRQDPEVRADPSLGDLIFSDVLYYKDLSAIKQMCNDRVITTEQVVRCYLVYGYTYLSEMVSLYSFKNGLIDQHTFQYLRSLIHSTKPSGSMSWFPKAQSLGRRLVDLADRVFPSSHWAKKSKAELGCWQTTRL